MKSNRYPKRDAIKNYFPLPNELFSLGLDTGAIAVYSYLLYLENRKTYQCHPSYKTIGNAVKMSPNTVHKYVAALEEGGLIVTEYTSIRTKDGRKRNGSLLYNIRPVQEAVNLFYERQLARVEVDAAKQRAAEKRQEYDRRHPQKPLCAPLTDKTTTDPSEDGIGAIEPILEGFRGTEEKAG